MPSGAKKQWTDELIEAELRRATGALGSFPSSSELRSMGRNDLACIISKSGGFVHWSERIGLPRTFSDSDFGWQGEVEMCELFNTSGYSASRTTGPKAPFDIIVNGVLKIDVKTAREADYGNTKNRCKGWFFRVGKIPQADVIVLYRADRKDFYGIPWWESTTSNITIAGSGGKYARYWNSWPMLAAMVRTRTAERESFNVPKAEVA